MELSRRCVPYTPLFKSLDKMNISIVTTAGVRLHSQEPYNDEGDERFMLLAGM